MSLAVRKSVVVDVAAARAFEVFTAKMTSWWPLTTHHIAKVPAREAVMEARAGGRWFEVGEDGSECEWGRVLVWEPPRRVVLDWQLSAAWEYDPQFHTELEIRFVPEDAGRTRVELEHRNLDAYGAVADEMKRRLDGPGAWGDILQRFAEVMR